MKITNKPRTSETRKGTRKHRWNRKVKRVVVHTWQEAQDYLEKTPNGMLCVNGVWLSAANFRVQ